MSPACTGRLDQPDDSLELTVGAALLRHRGLGFVLTAKRTHPIGAKTSRIVNVTKDAPNATHA
jgi:hypothetical protein